MSPASLGFLQSPGIWGPRNEPRLILWPSGGSLGTDRALTMRLGSALGMDTATAAMTLRRAVPIRLAGNKRGRELQQLWNSLRQMGLPVVLIGREWLAPVLDARIASSLSEDGRSLLDAEGQQLPIAPPVLVVDGTLKAIGRDRSDESAISRIRDPGNFHEFLGQARRILFFHASGVVLLRGERFRIPPECPAPDGILLGHPWVMRSVAPDGWLDTGYRWVEADSKNIRREQDDDDLQGIPRREWDILEYGAMAYSGLRQGVLRFDLLVEGEGPNSPQ